MKKILIFLIIYTTFLSVFLHFLGLDPRLALVFPVLIILLTAIFYILGVKPEEMLRLNRAEWMRKDIPEPKFLRILIASLIFGLFIPLSAISMFIIGEEVSNEILIRGIILYPIASLVFFVVM
ncbi:MAG TPA: hypothetical protein EYP60_01565, partial [bacterium (Candidatus Stahlbacteria)]|nr:hypothetical protein [Candidatus Stahlbacteria bacterium]